jgi:tetratricopeptide (TPR) repeat protein
MSSVKSLNLILRRAHSVVHSLSPGTTLLYSRIHCAETGHEHLHLNLNRDCDIMPSRMAKRRSRWQPEINLRELPALETCIEVPGLSLIGCLESCAGQEKLMSAMLVGVYPKVSSSKEKGWRRAHNRLPSFSNYCPASNMGKTRPPERSKLDRRKKKLIAEKKRKEKQSVSPQELLTQAADLLQQSDAASALQLATAALTHLKALIKTGADLASCLPALNLLGEINVELGDIEAAREYFGQAAQIDNDGDIPEELGGGPEKFFWLAQLSEEGGLDSVRWFERGASVLRTEIATLAASGDAEEALREKKTKLANALCGIAEIYMTDLSWDDDQAEETCNAVMEEALSVAPDSPETLQTLASVRISQLRKDDAQKYLAQSMSIWKDFLPEDPRIPDYPTRISLARLLMEAEMEDEAIEVIERLIQEDDTSIEAWYLGGWCLNLLADKQRAQINGKANGEAPEVLELLKRSRKWLSICLTTYQALDYEDERLRDHAQELIASLNEILGEPEETDSEDDAEDWEEDDDNDNDNEADDDDDEEMDGG